MTNLPRVASPLAVRYGVALLVFGSLLSFTWLAHVGAQDPADKGDAAKQAGAKKDKGGLFDDAEVDETKTKPNRNGPPPVVDLKKAARDAKNPVVKQLFNDLAEPYDLITYRKKDGPPFRESGFSRIKPLEKFYGDKQSLKSLPGEFAVEEFGKDWELKKASVPNYEIVTLQPYEQVAQTAVDKFMRLPLENYAAAPLPRYNQAVAAEQALSAVLVWHESKRSLGVRVGAEWDAVLAGLRKQFLGVLLEELQELTKLRDWDSAFALTQRLSENYPDEPDIARPLADLIKLSLDSPLDPTMRQRTRQRLEQLKERFPNNPDINAIIEDLKKKAQVLYDEAKKFEKSTDTAELKRAQDMLQKAEETWPQLQGLRAYTSQMRNKYPVLRVGVREWPKFMSPGMACTDSERRVVEFLFESLVKFSPDATGLGRYKPALAEGRPEVISMGRQFQLPANAFWSNDVELSAEDIGQTVRQLKKGQGNGLPAAWGELFADNQPVSTAGNPHRVNVKLSQGYVEPLSLMTFKILPKPSVLPESLHRPGGIDETRFAESPVGSGPFKFVPGNHSENGRPYLSFVANLNYGSRTSKLGLPRFREVRLFVYNDAVKELEANAHFLNLLLDLTGEEAAKLKEVGPSLGFRVTLPGPNAEVPNRRVYFLAINHRKTDLQSVAFRRVLLQAINREKLLDDYFRGGLGPQLHKALNGPFPAGSWANNPSVKGGSVNTKSADPFDPGVASAGLDALKAEQRYRPPALSLKYPAGDPVLKRAMSALAEQLEKTLPGVKITPAEVDPWALRDQVEKTHDFDLAYYHYDFPDDTNSLWPLFGGEDNLFGYKNDTLTDLLRQSMRYCDFEEVQRRARMLHQLFATLEVPLIPLWQLDPLLAIHNDVKTVPFDRNLIFTDIELWRLEGKQRD